MVYFLRIQPLYTLDTLKILLENRKITKYTKNIPLIDSENSFYIYWWKFWTYYCHDKYIFETEEIWKRWGEIGFVWGLYALLSTASELQVPFCNELQGKLSFGFSNRCFAQVYYAKGYPALGTLYKWMFSVCTAYMQQEPY